MKRNVLVLLFCGLLAILLCGCGDDPAPATEGATQEVTEESTEPEKTESSNTVTTDNFEITLNGATLAKDFEGNDVIVVDVTWTNNYSDAQMASVVLSIMGYQDGIQMDEAYVMQDESIDIDAKSKNIQPGTTQDVKYAFVLSNTTSDVTVEAEEWLGSGAKAEKIFTFTDGSLQ